MVNSWTNGDLLGELMGLSYQVRVDYLCILFLYIYKYLYRACCSSALAFNSNISGCNAREASC